MNQRRRLRAGFTLLDLLVVAAALLLLAAILCSFVLDSIQRKRRNQFEDRCKDVAASLHQKLELDGDRRLLPKASATPKSKNDDEPKSESAPPPAAKPAGP